MVGDHAIQETMETKKRSFKSGSCGIESIKGKELVSPPAKRMKQARLPFKPVTSPNQQKLSSPSPGVVKKSKLSDSSNGKAKHADKKTTPLKKADTPQCRKQLVIKVQKLRFTTNNSAVKAKSSKASQMASTHFETEVSSSSEDMKAADKGCNSTVATERDCDSSIATKKTPKASSLDGFVQTTQQPQVSTSDIIDLTSDADDEMEDDDDFAPSKSSSSQKKDAGQDCSETKPVRAQTDQEEEEEESDVSIVNTTISSISSLEQASSDEESSDNDSGDNAATTKVTPEKEKDDATVEIASSTQEKPKKVDKSDKKMAKSAKALQREAEIEKKREEKQKLREERKRKLEEEREGKKRQKLDQKTDKEMEREALRQQKAEEKKKKQMEKEMKKEQEEQERLEKKKAKEEEHIKKLQEVEAKQEEKRKKQEEKQKIEDEKRQKEAAVHMKKEKQSLMFKSFFKVQAPVPIKKQEVQGRFAPFEVKEDMVLAPCTRVRREDRDFSQLEEHFESQSGATLYLDQLRSRGYKPGKDVSTPGPVRPVQESMEVDMQPPVEEQPKKKQKQKGPKKPEGLKMKLLQFHENYRPAYYGTWQKESADITGRHPTKKDEDVFDYEFDSDDEWEEPGESLSHSEGEDEDGDGNGSGSDNEEEDGFFVPHGYLSAGEGGEDEEDKDSLKARQAAKARAWDNELKRRCEALKPMIITFMQVASTNKTREAERKKLEAYRAVPLTTTFPIATSYSIKRDRALATAEGGLPVDGEGVGMRHQSRVLGSTSNRLKPVPEEAMPDLLRLVHGNMAGIKSLIREFREYWRRKQHQASRPGSATPTPGADTPSPMIGDQTASPAARGSPVAELSGVEGTPPPVAGSSPSPVPTSGGTPSPQSLEHVAHVISKRQLDLKLNSIAVRDRRPQFKRICWYVHPHVLEKYKLTDLPVPTQWVNGVGAGGERNISPLPPSNIAANPAVAVSKPTVNKPIVTKMQSSPPGTVSSLLKASRGRSIPAMANQHILIPSSTMHSAFNKVGAVSSTSDAMHLPAGATNIQGVPFMQPISYISPVGTTLLPTGLATLQVLDMQPAMNQAINQGAYSVLQQAAATSLLANMQTTPPLNLNARLAPNATHLHPTMIPNSSALQQPRAPNAITAPSKGLPSLPSAQKMSPKRLDEAIAKLYKNGSLSPSAPLDKPKPVKKTATLANFFSVKTNKQPAADSKPQEVLADTSKE